METLTNIALYTGIGGLAIAGALYFFRSLIGQKIFSRLEPRESYKIIRLASLLVFAIAVLGISAHIYLQRTTPVNECALIREIQEVLERIDYELKFRADLEADDRLILEAFKESFEMRLQLNPKCEDLEAAEIKQEIRQATTILDKYEIR